MIYFLIGNVSIPSSACVNQVGEQILTLAVMILVHKAMRFAYVPQIVHNCLNVACFIWYFSLEAEFLMQPIINEMINFIIALGMVTFCQLFYARKKKRGVSTERLVEKMKLAKFVAICFSYAITFATVFASELKRVRR